MAAAEETSSEAGTVSSSGLDDADVVIFFHSATSDKMEHVENILQEKGIKCCLSYRDLPAGRLKTSNAFSASKHCPIRVYIMTKEFLDNEFRTYESLLGDPTTSTPDNTLFLVIGKQQRKRIPANMRHFACEELRRDVNTWKVAGHIENFARRRGITRRADLDFEGLVVEENSPGPSSGNQSKGGGDCAIDMVKYEKQLQRFNTMFGTRNKKRGYVLVTSRIGKLFPGLESLATIPWLRVFDFDPKSRVTGLLSIAEPVLKNTRHHTKTDLLDDIEVPDDKVTNWVFINGYSDTSDTLHQESRPISKTHVFNHSNALVEHFQGKKVPTTLVLWYTNFSNMDRSLDKFLNFMHVAFEGNLGSFPCIVCVEKIPDKRSVLYGMLDRLELLDQTLAIPLEVLCSWLESTTHPEVHESRDTKSLPKYPDEGDELVLASVEENSLQWIRVYFDVLAISQTTSRRETSTKETSSSDAKDGESFLKGAEITWNIVSNEQYVVEREFLGNVKTHIKKKYLATGKSGVVTLFHSPGGGGTTFARQLLWSLREIAPCIEMKSRQINLEELKERLTYIRNLTRLPTVLLVDGRSDHDVKKIMEVSRILLVVVLHVQRYYTYIDESKRIEDTCYLHDRVSKNEADRFRDVFSSVAMDSHKNALATLSWDIRRGNEHFVFEYGLTAFQAEFRGVRRYVHGHLQIKEDEELQDWHTVLAFLSMANYYGHRGLPSKLFNKILRRGDDEVVDLFEGLPHSACQFITENVEGDWQITHYIVSKVILEQIFVKRSTTDYKSERNRLTTEARERLCIWALQFIENIKLNVRKAKYLPGHISEILISIFIRRYYNDPGENEVENKSHFSRLVEDAHSQDGQCQILQKLVDCFPNEPEFYAHLGRFYYKQAMHTKAEECLTKAVEIRLEKLARTPSTHTDDVLERIYNMFGFCYNSRVRYDIGASLGRLQLSTIEDKKWPSLIRTCLENAEKAIENFANGRKWYQKGSNPTFSYLGEVKVRLHLTELARVISGGDVTSLLTRQSPYKELGEFAMNSFHECDQLLAQCIYQSSGKDIPEQEINFCVNNFQYLFTTAREALSHWAGNDVSVQSKRCHVSILKMHLKEKKKGSAYRFRVYEDAQSVGQVKQLVDLYEGIFGDVDKNRFTFRISNYMMEWLQAIRHRNIYRPYSQSEVLTRVKKWDEKKEPGSLATFYRYVVTTLLSICAPPGEVANAYSQESARLKEEVEKYMVPLHLFDKSMEWLACSSNSQDFNNLINSSSLPEWNGRFWAGDTLQKFQVCSGTIQRCKTHLGWIVLDGGQAPAILAFFVPQKYEIGISHSKQKTRVEFYLGFNPRHGAEAYEVTLMQSFPCPACRSQTEVCTLGKEPHEWAAQCRRCEAMVRPNRNA